MAKISTKKKLLMQTILMTKSLDKREILMTKSLTMNNFKKTTETLTHDKKLIKQWRNATTQGY